MKTNALLAATLVPASNPATTSWPIWQPHDSSECVFMGRAVHQLARAKFGSEWTGDEHATRLHEPLPDCLDPEHYNALLHPESRTESAESAQWIDPPSRAVLERAYDLLITHRPDLQKPPRMFGLLARIMHEQQRLVA